MGYVPACDFACIDAVVVIMGFPCRRRTLASLRARVVACPGLAATSFASLLLLSCLRFVSFAVRR